MIFSPCGFVGSSIELFGVYDSSFILGNKPFSDATAQPFVLGSVCVFVLRAVLLQLGQMPASTIASPLQHEVVSCRITNVPEA